VSRATADGSGTMFDRIAPRYDLLNRIISLGQDGRWRRRLIAALDLPDDARVLDVATGTGDVAVALAARHQVVGLDPSAQMLAVADAKVALRGLSERVTLVCGRAEALPFEDGSFDASCIAFGIRNVPDRPRGLAEMARVTKPGGRVVVLELGDPDAGLLAPLARVHVHHVLPRIGGWLSGDDEYRYLARSIAAFPKPAAFGEMLEAAGLSLVSVERFVWGGANLFVARR
jgi:demethylmenaquinone methyltransferase/2-methoxy-6-polyprenyl-1,4-benzoquinol methylase